MKVTEVIWTTEALKDLDSIYDFISEGSIAAAGKIITAILERGDQLEKHPESGQKQETLREVNHNPYRYLIEGNYKIIYNYRGSVIYIITVFDTRQDPTKLKT